MKYALECSIDSLTKIEEEFEIRYENKKYILTPNEKGFIVKIKIIKDIEEPEKFYSEISPGKGESVATFTIRSDTEIHNELISDFQYLESQISFGGNYTKIHWEDPKTEYIPESKEEREKLKILSVERRSGGYPVEPILLREEDFKWFIETKEHYEELSVLKAFFCNGRTEFHDYNYINAFYNFYFIIEDLYGNGNTRNSLILKSFKESEELKGHINWVMENHIKTDARHFKNITNFLSDMGKTPVIDDIIEFLVLTRGRLHHFTRKSTLKIGTPFNQRQYESVAYLSMGLDYRGIIQRILEKNRELGIAKD